MPDKGTDPAVIWQTMLGEMEKGFNSFANQAMASPEFSKAMNQVGGVTAGAQKQLGELMEKYLLAMNLTSRAQMVGMAERLQSIEGQLNEIKAMLHQVHHNSLAPDGGARGPPPPAPPPPPPPTPRHGRESKKDRSRRSRSGLHLGAGPVRGAARDPAQHQGRRIFFLVRPFARLNAQGHSGRSRDH